MVCYVARLVCDFSGNRSNSNPSTARWWWTAGLMVFLVHVIAAFHFQHHWNHAAALEYTARRTQELTGWNTGVGLYVNEAFLGLWLLDACCWWYDLDWPRHRWVYWTVQSIFAFLMFQATVVFGQWFWTPASILVIPGLLLLAARNRRGESLLAEK